MVSTNTALWADAADSEGFKVQCLKYFGLYDILVLPRRSSAPDIHLGFSRDVSEGGQKQLEASVSLSGPNGTCVAVAYLPRKLFRLKGGEAFARNTDTVLCFPEYLL